MGYNANERINGETANEEKAALPEQSMADIMHETSALAEDALNIACRISGFLFPENSSTAERPEDIRCFRDELLKTRYQLHITVTKLAEIAVLLGA